MVETSHEAAQLFIGTWGELWVNGRKMAETTAFQAKISKTKKPVELCGTMFEHSVVTGLKGTGSVTINTVDHEIVDMQAGVKDGVDPTFTFVGKVKNKVTGAEIRYSFSGVSFDDISLMDWKSAEACKATLPFTFTDYKPL